MIRIIPKRKLALLESIDLGSLVQNREDGPDFAPLEGIAHHDGTRLPPSEITLLGSVSRAELAAYQNLVMTEADKIANAVAATDELHALVEEEWALRPALSLGDIVHRLPELERNRALYLVQKLGLDPSSGGSEQEGR